MTSGHKHRIVTVPSWDTWYVRLLRKPLWHCRDIRRVDESPYPYGPCAKTKRANPTCWTLSLLGILHRWTGLTLYVEEGDDWW